MSVRHFLSLLDLSSDELHQLIERAVELKQWQKQGRIYEPLKNKVMAMVFEKSSTRTRVSFETGMAQLGGHAIFLSPRDTQFGRGEPIEDSARVLSSMTDAVMIRTFEHEKVERFAEYSVSPVINALTDQYHPCQLLADMQTWFEHRGDIRGAKVTFIGDGLELYKDDIRKCQEITPEFAKKKDFFPQAQYLVPLVLERFAKGEADNIGQLVPLYLYPDHCQIKNK